MKSIASMPDYVRIRHSGNGEKPTKDVQSFIENINSCLEWIIICTWHFNKPASVDEIHKRLIMACNDKEPDLETVVDPDTVEEICQNLSHTRCDLIQRKRNNTSYYKLNHKNIV